MAEHGVQQGQEEEEERDQADQRLITQPAMIEVIYSILFYRGKYNCRRYSRREPKAFGLQGKRLSP